MGKRGCAGLAAAALGLAWSIALRVRRRRRRLVVAAGGVSEKAEWNGGFGWVVLWDVENCPVPAGVSGGEFVCKLRARLTGYRGGNCDPVLRIVAVTNVARLGAPMRNQLQANGVSLLHVETRGRKDAADKALIAELCFVPREFAAPFGVALLSGDGDFAYALSRVRNLGYATVVIAQEMRCSELLRSIPDSLWSMQKDILDCEHAVGSACAVGAGGGGGVGAAESAPSLSDEARLERQVQAMRKEIGELKHAVTTFAKRSENQSSRDGAGRREAFAPPSGRKRTVAGRNRVAGAVAGPNFAAVSVVKLGDAVSKLQEGLGRRRRLGVVLGVALLFAIAFHGALRDATPSLFGGVSRLRAFTNVDGLMKKTLLLASALIAVTATNVMMAVGYHAFMETRGNNYARPRQTKRQRRRS